MSRNRRYPMIRDDGALQGRHEHECEACDKPAGHWVRIAYDYMRGNDETVYSCARHYQMARSNFNRFMAHLATKEKFCGNKSTNKDQP